MRDLSDLKSAAAAFRQLEALKSKLRILHLEDSSDDAELILRSLAGDGLACEVKRVESRRDFVAALEGDSFDLILADCAVPSFDGVSALGIAREICPGVPLIFVSGSVGEKKVIELLKSEAADCVLKDELSSLVPAARRALNEAMAKVERQRVEREREMTIQLLRLANESTETRDLARAVTTFLQEHTGCDAVGMRLSDGEDFPYFEARGFSKQFVLSENRLCARDGEGQLIRNSSGDPVMECMCGSVIMGRFDSSKPFFTAAGSFWTNSTTELLENTTETDRRAHTRNRCSAEGYESVALIPLKLGERCLGLLQFNDRRKGLFSPETIGTWERLAGHLTIALAKFRAEEELRKSEERYRSLFEHMVEGYAHCRMLFDGDKPTDFLYLDVNKAFGTLTGLVNVAGKKVSEVIPGIRQSDPALFDIFGRVALTGRPERFEIYVEALGDWFSLSVYSPQKEYFVAVFDVITERRNAEEALMESEARFSKVFHSSPVGIVISRLSDGAFFDVNDAFLNIYGYRWEDIIGHTSYDLELWVNPAEREGMISLLRSHGRVQNIEARFRRKSGETGDLLISAELIELAGEECVLGMFSDITERKRIEEALRESEEKYRQLVDNAPVGIYKASLSGKFLYVNRALATTFEFGSPEEMIAENILSRYRNPGDRKAFLDALMESGRVNNFELDTLSKSGRQIHLLLNSTLEGDVISGMVLNVTEQKTLEAQLRHSQKMEAIGTLAGGIAHDFNNILSTILGFGALAKDKMERGFPATEHLKEVLAAAERAASLTQRLLAFSRKQNPDLKPVDINEIVTSLGKMLSRIIGEDIDLITRQDRKKLPVMADARQIEQVLMNLATNARDAMPDGGTLTLSTGLLEIDRDFVSAYGYGRPGQYAFISAADTGSGMDRETQKKIFEPFFTTKGVGKGTGLGLSIAYGIVKQHGGFINVDSEEEKGTTFRILIPLFENLTEKADAAGAAVSPRGGTETILVAEDDASLRKLSRIVLESLGYNVITAKDGEEALARFTENSERIELVILDMIMPRKNGREVYEEIRKTNPGIKTIFASGYTLDLINRRELLEEGMECIMKPISPKDLLKKVREVLDRQD